MRDYAISELVLFLCAAAGAWMLLRRGRDIDRDAGLIMAVALMFLGAAALIGAIRYGFDILGPLRLTHRYLTNLFSVAGMALIAGALLTCAKPEVFAGKSSWIIGAALAVYVIVVLTGSSPTTITLIGAVNAGAAIGAGAALAKFGSWRAGLAAILGVVIIAAAGLVVGSGPDKISGLIARWHVFHLMLASAAALLAWSVLLVKPENVRR